MQADTQHVWMTQSGRASCGSRCRSSCAARRITSLETQCTTDQEQVRSSTAWEKGDANASEHKHANMLWAITALTAFADFAAAHQRCASTDAAAAALPKGVGMWLRLALPWLPKDASWPCTGVDASLPLCTDCLAAAAAAASATTSFSCSCCSRCAAWLDAAGQAGSKQHKRSACALHS